MTDALDGDFGGTFPFESRYLRAGRTSLHYVDEGPADASPLLFLHGNPTWSYLWRRPLAELSAGGHRCVAYDHMGFGRSEKPPLLSPYTLERHIENALAVIDELELRDVTLVAHDWGGPIGLGAMLDRPDRLRALVLMNTWSSGKSRNAGPVGASAATRRPSSTRPGISLVVSAVRASLVTACTNRMWSISCSEPCLHRNAGARPPSTSIGDAFCSADAIPLIPLVTPGPAVRAHTPGERVAFAHPSAANAADCSCRTSTMSTPSSRHPS